MANQTINVRTWSKRVPRHRFRPELLDLYAVKNHDEIVRALGYERRDPSAATVRGAAVGLGQLAFVLALVAGVAGIAGTVLAYDPASGTVTDTGLPLDEDVVFSVTVVSFCIVLVGVLVITLSWLRARRHWSLVERGFLIATIACAVVALLSLGRTFDVDVLGFAPASIPVWAALGAAVVVLAAQLTLSQGKRQQLTSDFRRVGEPDHHRAMTLVAGLDVKQRDRLTAERRRAIDRLRERGVIDDDEERRLGALPLGAAPIP